MKRTTHALPTGRIFFLRALTIVAIILVIGRLFQVSIIDHSQAVGAAKDQYSVREKVAAKRGKILMQDLISGQDYPVALNVDSFTVVADPFLMKDPTKVAAALQPVLQMSLDELVSKLSDKHKRFVVLKKKLEKQDAKKVEALNLRGISLESVPVRLYPEGNLASQVIGFVNGEGEGKYGIEGFFNEDLTGYAGYTEGEKDAKRRIISEGKSAQPRNGTDITLSIDHNLQFIVEQKLKDAIKQYEAEGGSVVVMDTKTGAILAMANNPDFDLNNYNQVPADQQKVFLNSAVSDTWEPGSIYKTFTLATGVDLGLFDSETALDLTCFVTVDGFEIHNAENKCYNHPTITDVLTQSINIGTIWAADKIGNDNFSKYIANFGFGSKTSIELQPEAAGRIQDVKRWRNVNRATISFGQGLTTSPLQIVTAYSAIANSGKLMKPYIVAKRVDASGKEIATRPKEIRQVVKPETAAMVTHMLEKVVTEGHGKRAQVAGYKVAGKTGTAQVVGDDGKYIEDQHIGSFAGFFPSDDPKFAMIVKLDKPKAVEFAESSAAPTFGEIAQWLLHYAKVPPSQVN